MAARDYSECIVIATDVLVEMAELRWSTIASEVGLRGNVREFKRSKVRWERDCLLMERFTPECREIPRVLTLPLDLLDLSGDHLRWALRGHFPLRCDSCAAAWPERTGTCDCGPRYSEQVLAWRDEAPQPRYLVSDFVYGHPQPAGPGRRARLVFDLLESKVATWVWKRWRSAWAEPEENFLVEATTTGVMRTFDDWAGGDPRRLHSRLVQDLGRDFAPRFWRDGPDLPGSLAHFADLGTEDAPPRVL